MKIVLIGGHPKGFPEPFDPKTRSGKVLRKMVGDLKLEPTFFDLWDNQDEQDRGKLSPTVLSKLAKFKNQSCVLVALGKFTEKALLENGIACTYLPHPASRHAKFTKRLKEGLSGFCGH